MKLEPHLPRLPSIGELLEHPRVREIVGRINRSTIAQRATGFIEELRTSLVERAGHLEIPPISQLAERLARRLLGEEVSGMAAINATGVVVGDPAFAPPLAEKAVHAMLQAASEYHRREALLAPLERDLSRLAGAESALVCSSFAGAVALCRAATAAMPCRLDVEPLAGLLNPGDYGFQPISTLAERASAGADVVIADGSGLIGGPACGVIVGRRRFINAMAAHEHAASLALDSLRAAALRATLDAYGEGQAETAMFQIPVWQLLSAPRANLQQRAERLALLAAQSPGVASADAREAESAWALRDAEELRATSWSVAVAPANGDAASLAARLGRGERPIAATVTAGCVHLELRSVFPRWDQQLIAGLDAAGK